LSPRLGPGTPSTDAPSVALSEGGVGSESDLELRIDVPPLASAGGAFAPTALKKLLTEAKLEGALQLASPRPLPGEVFVGSESAVVLQAGSDWKGEEVRSALVAAVESLYSTSRLGLNWVEKKADAESYYELDGLAHLSMATPGRILIVANGGGPVVAVLKRLSHSPGDVKAVYAAGFRHERERADLAKMLRLVETPLAQQSGMRKGSRGREPMFLSENLASLSKSLARVEEESILVRDRGPLLSQTVTYRLSK
jgi:hypothetical protein